jgi:putative ATPase
MGMPGCHGPLGELVTYLAEAPKSTRAYEGYNRAERLMKRDPTLFVPISMRDIPVRGVEAMGEEVYRYHPKYRCAMIRLPNVELEVKFSL